MNNSDNDISNTIANNFYLKYLYFKTRLHQKIYHDGTFPFKYYSKLTAYVKKYNIENALECGTAIGLTSMSILMGNNKVKLTTIEKHQRNINKAKSNFVPKYYFTNKKVKIFDFEDKYKRCNFICDRYLDFLEKQENIKKYDLIFLDAYVSRINEVKFLSNYIQSGGIFIISNIRENIPKSLQARDFIYDKNHFEILERIEDTIFAIKK
jgi:predicted O-methyltransferase YrrM